MPVVVLGIGERGEPGSKGAREGVGIADEVGERGAERLGVGLVGGDERDGALRWSGSRRPRRRVIATSRGRGLGSVSESGT